MSEAPLEHGSKGTSPATPQAPKGALGIVFLIVVLDLMGFGIIIPLLAFYVPDFQANPLKVTLLFAAYSFCQFLGAPVLGVLSDAIGRRPVLAFSQLGSAAGYVLLGLAGLNWRNPAMALRLVYLSRIIDGFTGGNISTAQAYISDVTTHENRAKGMGLLGAAFGIGFSVGPAVGGLLGHLSLALPGYAAAGFSLLAAVLCFARLPETRHDKPTEAEQWLHPRRFLPVLRRPLVAQLLVISFCVMAAFVMMESTIAMYLNKLRGWHEAQVGGYFAFIGLIIIIVQGGLIGRLTRAFGEWPLAAIGPLLVAVGMAGYTTLAWHNVLTVLFLSGAVNATGAAFSSQPSPPCSRNSAGETNKGSSSASTRD